LGLFLLLILGFIELALAVARYDMLSHAARHLARQTIVHGRLAPPHKTTWGPETLELTADDSAEPAECVRSQLGTMNPADVAIRLEWLDGDHLDGSRIRATLTYDNRASIPWLSFLGSRRLEAASTMIIAH
jgi:hypothetical protein